MGLAGHRATCIPLPGSGSQESGGCPGTAGSQEQGTDSEIKRGLQNPRDLHQSITTPFVSLGSWFLQTGSIATGLSHARVRWARVRQGGPSLVTQL